MSTEICVLCSAKLESKVLLQEHFRKHANNEIDIKGRSLSKSNHAQSSQVKSAAQTSKNCLASLPESLHRVSHSTQTESEAKPQACVNTMAPGPSGSSLSAQVKTQTVPCDICGAQFQKTAAAIKHKWRFHPKEPSNFCCSHCGKHFPLKTFLENHTNKEHAGALPQNVEEIFPCDDCSLRFSNEAAKGAHAEVAHRRIDFVLKPVATPPPSKKIRLNNAGEAESVYYCHLCGSEYILKFNFRKHLEQRHSNEDTNFESCTEVIRCTTCDAVFCNKEAYEAHNRYHQPSDLYVTSEEHRLQTVSRVDQDFDLRRVQVDVPKTVYGYAKQKMNFIFQMQHNRLGFPTFPVSGAAPQQNVEKNFTQHGKSDIKTESKVLRGNENSVAQNSQDDLDLSPSVRVSSRKKPEAQVSGYHGQ